MIEGGDRAGRDRIRRILKELIDSYSHIMGGSADPSRDNRVIIYEMSGLRQIPTHVAAPATELLLHNIVSKLDGSPAWVLADEFWSLLGDEISATWLFDTIRTLRKKNCSFVGVTQSLVEIVNSPDRDLLLENLPGHIFLPNHAARGAYVSENYLKIGVSEHEIASITRGSIGDFLYKSAAGTRAATCLLGPAGQAVCASTSYTAGLTARGLLAEGGDFCARWLQEQGVHVPSAATVTVGRGS